ncbi:hypothetical protein L210DRAFT_3670223 [Boletus edulis BED1]|uniref:Uncharacterized protein n=1 Tax=Boletus edulis BED1 TaxID=1328754 RepID=A0AAD4BEB9_BOLED|nr:hypothetical protein L210DRAFT_3670223 [Boletus edulis BED1]
MSPLHNVSPPARTTQAVTPLEPIQSLPPATPDTNIDPFELDPPARNAPSHAVQSLPLVLGCFERWRTGRSLTKETWAFNLGSRWYYWVLCHVIQLAIFFLVKYCKLQTGLNYLKGEPPILAKPDEEYPPWLWELTKPRQLVDDGLGGKAEKRWLR